MNGVIDGLNQILDLAVAEYRGQGGTYIIPGSGRLSDTADVASYRNMMVMVRDRIQDLIEKGMTLDQVKAAKPTMDFDGSYGSTSGPGPRTCSSRRFTKASRTPGNATSSSLLVVVLLVTTSAYAQRGARGGAAASADRTRCARHRSDRLLGVRDQRRLALDEWSRRQKGEYDALTLNAEGRRVGDTWDPDRDEKAGEQCKAYGAANMMRLPGRLHISWENDNTLRIDTDTGNQTRRFHFDATPPGEPTWQGHSAATWQLGPAERGAARAGKLEGRHHESPRRVHP